jgi:hypothetical protein
MTHRSRKATHSFPSQKAVIVLGMSRSGTSLLTRGIHVLGVALGDNLLPSTAANPKGYWENADIVNINERLLELIGCTWHSLALTGAIDFSSRCFDAVRETARHIIEIFNSQYPVWGFKDPRACRLLPFWQELLKDLEVGINYIVCVRSPIDVALSLEKRDHFGMQKSLLLWLSHMYGIAKSINNDQSVVIAYEELMDRPCEQIHRIAEFLDIDASNKQQAIHEYCRCFLDPGLHHHSSNRNKLQAVTGAFREISACYDHLVSLASRSRVRKKDWMELTRPMDGLGLTWGIFHEISEDEIRKLRTAPLSKWHPLTERRHVGLGTLESQQRPVESLILFVDYPERIQPVPVFRKLAVSGWAISLSGVAHVQALLPDRTRVYLDYGLPRKDVQALHPTYPYADSSGFSGCFNLSHLAPGGYALSLRVTSRSGEVREARIPFVKMDPRPHDQRIVPKENPI